MRARTITFTIVVIAVAGLLWYWQNYLTYDGEVSHFEAPIRRQVSPVALQAWATNLLHDYSDSNTTSIALHSGMFPPEVQNLNSRILFGFVMPNASEEQAHIRIIWGSGMRGHWGLRVGSTNFVEYGGEMWKQGVNFWRELRR